MTKSHSRRIKLGADGKTTIPAEILKALNLEGVEELVISLEGDAIELRTVNAAIKRAQALMRDHRKDGTSIVDELIAERRKEAAKE